MTYVSNTSNVRFDGLSGRFARMAAALKLMRARRRAYQLTFNELSSMTDRDLADIGLCRSLIREVALQAADEIR
ncbi:DUF1127 domain-containing protein [Tropicimonas sp.]|uniref:DUF1127 domain-containing protein n=1 Tax=Tropicimonas sp. TaxID=2067044 RepID=UPI003A84DF81